MIERIYAIYDRQARHFLKGNIPFVMLYPNDAVARREFAEIANQIPHLKKYPDDFVLVKLGTLNVETGEIESSKSVGGQPPVDDTYCLIMTARDAIGQDPRQLDLTDERLQRKRDGRQNEALEPAQNQNR